MAIGASTGSGNFFEDFRVGQVIEHATPRTVTAGDVALYQALYGPRFALQSSDEFARALSLQSHIRLSLSRWILPVPLRVECLNRSLDIFFLVIPNLKEK